MTVKPAQLSLALAAACAAVLLVPPAAGAALRAAPSVQTKSGATRLVVKLTSTRRVAARRRPTAVRVKVGRRTYKLTRVRGTRVAVVRLGTWRSAAYRGAVARAFRRLVGKRLTVLVRSRAGVTTLRPKVAAPTATPPATAPPTATPPPTTTTPPAAQRPAQVTGDQATQAFQAALVGQRLLWRNSPTGYTAQEAWGFCDTTMRTQYQSSTIFQDPVDYYYSVTTAFIHPTEIPQAELLGQIARQSGSGDTTYWNIAIAYGRTAGVWAEAGKTSSYEFAMGPWTCGAPVL